MRSGVRRSGGSALRSGRRNYALAGCARRAAVVRLEQSYLESSGSTTGGPHAWKQVYGPNPLEIRGARRKPPGPSPPSSD